MVGSVRILDALSKDTALLEGSIDKFGFANLFDSGLGQLKLGENTMDHHHDVPVGCISLDYLNHDMMQIALIFAWKHIL